MKLCSTVVLYLFIAATFVRSQQCYEHDFGWKGNNVKALNDCDILNRTSPLHLDILVAKTQCVTSFLTIFEDSNKATTRAGPYQSPDKTVQLRGVPHKCLTHDVKITVHCGDCIGARRYETKFKLNPMKCYDMGKELNFTINQETSTALINNEYFHKSNKYVSSCMRSVSLINSNGTEIDTLWKKEYEVPVDRCKNETFTLNYKFVSSKNSEGKMLEKVIEVPWDPNCLESKKDQIVSASTVAAVAIAAGLLVTATLVTICVVCYKRKAAAKDVQELNHEADFNPVYGTYSRGWDEDGEYGDGDVVEVTDDNPVYGT